MKEAKHMGGEVTISKLKCIAFFKGLSSWKKLFKAETIFFALRL